jgi:hypothetical protein
MNTTVHIYTRKTNHDADAWTYERTTAKETAQIEVDLNPVFGLETLLVPSTFPAGRWLDSCQTQEDFR